MFLCYNNSCIRRNSGKQRTTLLPNRFTPTTIIAMVTRTVTIIPTITMSIMITVVTMSPTVSITTALSIIEASRATAPIAVSTRATRRTIAETSTMATKTITCNQCTITEIEKTIMEIIYLIVSTVKRVPTPSSQ